MSRSPTWSNACASVSSGFSPIAISRAQTFVSSVTFNMAASCARVVRGSLPVTGQILTAGRWLGPSRVAVGSAAVGLEKSECEVPDGGVQGSVGDPLADVVDGLLRRLVVFVLSVRTLELLEAREEV